MDTNPTFQSLKSESHKKAYVLQLHVSESRPDCRALLKFLPYVVSLNPWSGQVILETGRREVMEKEEIEETERERMYPRKYI